MGSESRLLSLLSLMGSGSVRTADDLAEHFGVTSRTIRRDIASLRELGYTIDAAPGADGGYRAGSHTVLPPLQLESGEALATAIGLSLLRGAGLSTPMADTATQKLRAMLPPALRSTIGDIASSVSVLPGHEPDVDHGTVMAIASAAASRCLLDFAYAKQSDRSRNGAAPALRRVEPVQMVVLGAHWYLYAWDLDRADWRVFRLDRMSEVRATTFRFDHRPHPDAEAAVRAGVTTDAYDHRIVIEVEASAERAREWFPTRSATVTAVTGKRRTTSAGPEVGNGGDTSATRVERKRPSPRCRVEFGVADLDWAAAVITRIPAEFHVIGPDALIDSLRNLAGRVERALASAE